MEEIKKTDYFKMSRALSIVLAAIPITSWVLGVVVRFKESPWEAVIRIFLGWNIFWFLDLISIIIDKQIFRIIEKDEKKEKQKKIKEAGRKKNNYYN